VGGACGANGGEEGLKRRWVDDIKMDLVEMGSDGVDWIGVAMERE
jgi:hypothetical protein